jgi:FkbM family methyltransferase
MKYLLKKCFDYISAQIFSRLTIYSQQIGKDQVSWALISEHSSKVLLEMLQKLEDRNQNLVTNYLIEGIYPSILTINRNGFRIFLDPRDPFISVHYLQSLSWEPQITSIFKEVFETYKIHQLDMRSRALFIDCGANIGLHSMEAAKIGYEVFAFEPEPITYKFLELNRIINGLQFKSEKLAVADVDGVLEFIIDTQSSGMNGLLKSKSGTGRFKEQIDHLGRFHSIKVDSIKLSNYFGNEIRESNKSLLCLKIDTEGAEGEVIVGARDLIQRFESYLIISEMHLDNLELVKQYDLLIKTEISARKYITLRLLRFMKEPIVLNHNDSSTWHQYGYGDLALYVSYRDIFKF